MTSSYLGRVFLLAAVMYVNDTDLLHWAENQNTSDEEMIKKVQEELNLWSEIMHSTGAVLNALKSSLFLLLYKWSNGRPKLKTARDLPEAEHEVVGMRTMSDPNEDLTKLTVEVLKERLKEDN